MADQPDELIGKPQKEMDESERHDSLSEAVAQSPAQENPGQNRVRDLATKAISGTLTGPEIQEALKLLLRAQITGSGSFEDS